MTRGIHLRRLRSTDLKLLGVADARLPDAREGREGECPNALAEADPALSLVVAEVRQGLEGTLRLLDEALAAGTARSAKKPAKSPADHA